MNRPPNSKNNLDRAIQRFAVDNSRVPALRSELANVIVAQMICAGVVKGGTGLRLRYGELAARVTKDLDTAYKTSLDEFLRDIKARLAHGWQGFTGEVVVLRQAAPKGMPFEYVMQPCDVKLSCLGTPWYTVSLEIGHNEIGDANESDQILPPEEIRNLLAFLSMPAASPICVMKLEYQIAQKLHGVTGYHSHRAHDLIDLQLMLAHGEPDWRRLKSLCRQLFAYRKQQAWPPVVTKNEDWDIAYQGQKGDLPVLPTVDEAIVWAQTLIGRIESSV